MSMTPEQKIIAIAEFEGWTSCQLIHGDPMGRPPNVSDQFKHLPPYLTSRDAICEVVEKLDDLRLREYAEHLQEVCHIYCVGVVPDYRRHLRNLAKITLATASQMADALLLTLRYQI